MKSSTQNPGEVLRLFLYPKVAYPEEFASRAIAPLRLIQVADRELKSTDRS
jgi:hypothetical protein